MEKSPSPRAPEDSDCEPGSMVYGAGNFVSPTLECDLIMKGGITSGVVYPFAIAELAKVYRFRSIGGTSAGAIAAVFTAAAEYNRREKTKAGRGDEAGDGFVRLCAVAGELGTGLRGLFQPSPELKPLFTMLMTAVSGRADRIGTGPAILLALPGIFPLRFLAGLLVIAVIGAFALAAGNFWLGVLGVVLGLVVITGLVVHALYRLVAVTLPEHDFGICSGKTVTGDRPLAFSDWIADQIDLIAGNVDAAGRLGTPLTIGQLRGDTDLDPDGEIKVATMTTDLSSARPYQLPLKSDIHYFSKAEFEKLFPERLINYLCKTGGPYTPARPEASLPSDLHRLPVGDDFPVFLVARMSLSFPGLIRAVPLYREDATAAKPGTPAPLRRCLLSDGGISSNFPIHFFDSMLPRRPTFGIALASLDPTDPSRRIDLPTSGRASTDLPVATFGSVGSFLFGILNTAKDWQDTLQSLLPGYAERIVTIRLDDRTEGGLNLDMGQTEIDRLACIGQKAGKTLRNRFSFSQHRYDRAITMLSAIEDSLDGLGEAYDHRPSTAGTPWLGYDEILETFQSANYPNGDAWRKNPLHVLAKELAELGKDAHRRNQGTPRSSIRSGNLPPQDYRFRLVAVADLAPTKTTLANAAKGGAAAGNGPSDPDATDGLAGPEGRPLA